MVLPKIKTPFVDAAVTIIAAVELPDAGAWPQLVTVLPLKLTIAAALLTVKALERPVKVLVLITEPGVAGLAVVSADVALIPLPRYWSVVLVAPVKVLPLTVTSYGAEIP